MYISRVRFVRWVICIVLLLVLLLLRAGEGSGVDEVEFMVVLLSSGGVGGNWGDLWSSMVDGGSRETVRLDVGEAVGYVSAVVWYGLVRRKERVTERMEYFVLQVLYS
jgi:hypothetical protein